MARYLTPTVLRAMGTGIPLGTIPDADIAGIIANAESRMDAYVSSREDISFGLAGGTQTERARWDRLTRRVYPSCFPVPVQTVNSYSVVVGQNSVMGVPTPVVANVDPSLVIINNDLGYLECVSLAVVAFGLTPVVAQITVIEPFVTVNYTSGYSIAKTLFPLYQTLVAAPTVNSNPIGSLTANTWHSFLPYWDTTVTPQVYLNGALLTSGQYTVNTVDGCVTIPSATETSLVQATFNHTIPDVVTQAARWASLDVFDQYFQAYRNASGFEQVHTGDQRLVRRQFRGDVEPMWQSLLKPYRRATIALS